MDEDAIMSVLKSLKSIVKKNENLFFLFLKRLFKSSVCMRQFFFKRKKEKKGEKKRSALIAKSFLCSFVSLSQAFIPACVTSARRRRRPCTRNESEKKLWK